MYETIFVPNYAPLYLELIRFNHDIPSAGHPGKGKTLELVTSLYYRPKMSQNIAQYFCNCRICSLSQSSRYVPYGSLNPVPIPHCL